jgi:hypothetical protein
VNKKLDMEGITKNILILSMVNSSDQSGPLRAVPRVLDKNSAVAQSILQAVAKLEETASGDLEQQVRAVSLLEIAKRRCTNSRS